MRVLVAGCGAMGLPMAENLVAAGFDVVGFDVRTSDTLNSSPVPMLDSVHDAAAEVLLLVVRTAKDIDDVCFDVQAIFSSENPQPPKHVIVSSTVAKPDVLSLRQRLPESVSLVEAPMSGAPVAAREKRLSFMLAGDNETLDYHQPLFDAMGTHWFRVGELGCGMLVKTMNNTLAATSVLVTRRVLADARTEGVDEELLLNVLNASSGATWFSKNMDVIDWADEGYSVDSTIGILEKDVRCAMASLSRSTDEFDDALLGALAKMEARDS